MTIPILATFFVVAIPALTAVPLVETTATPAPANDVDESPYVSARLLIVSSHRSYASALKAAKRFSHESGIAYDSYGRVFDKERGLIVPDDDADEIWAGQYIPRRYDECAEGACVTIERSDGYEGFEPGLYIVVAGITHAADTAVRLADVRRHAPGAYAKQTTLYMGCMH